MRVCHITTVHPNRYDSRIFEKECESLADAGYEVYLLVNDELADETKCGVKIVSLRKKAKNRLDRVTRIAHAALKKALEINAEIYHIHDPELLLISGALKSKGKKVIFDSHEFTAIQILSKSYIPRFARQYFSNLYKKIETKCINKIDGLVYPCTYEGKDYFSECLVPKVLIGNLPSTEIISKLNSAEKVNKYDNRICYIGGITESRGAITMMKAAYLANKKLVLIGPIESNLKKRMELMSESSCVIFLGQLPHEDALNEAKKCSIGLSLLLDVGQYAKLDNLPTKLYEYMLIGLPTIVSNFPYYKEQLKKYEFGIAVNPMNEVEIANAIETISKNEKIRTHLIEEGERAIDNEYNWNFEKKRMLDFYSLVCLK